MDRGGLVDWYNITVLGVGWIDEGDPYRIRDLVISSPDVPNIQLTDQEKAALTRAMLYEFQYYINNPVDAAPPPIPLDTSRAAK